MKVVNAADFGRVAVLMGGWSAEREVSLMSGKAVHEAMQGRSIQVTAVDASRENILQLKAQGFDRAFNMLHGIGGEDGVVQAALELQGIPYTGSGVLASALAMDKLRTKQIWQSAGIPCAPHVLLDERSDFDAVVRQLGLPIFVKPATEGSSIGMTKVKKAEELKPAFELARKYCPLVLAEQFIAGREFTAAVLARQVLPFVWIEPAGEYYDYHAKYVSNDTRYHCPSGIDAALEKTIGQLALKAFDALGASGWSRVDFMLDPQNRPWFLEINTLPGMTSHSLFPVAAKALGISFDQLVWKILETSMEAPA
ncbi:MAG: D-alanine--D-alanine ligase [Nevskiales bacterium]